MGFLIAILCLNQWGRTPAQEHARVAGIIRAHASETRAWERMRVKRDGPKGSLSRAKVDCADYSHGWIVDDRRDVPHWYYCVPAENHPELTCETDPAMKKSPGQFCVSVQR